MEMYEKSPKPRGCPLRCNYNFADFLNWVYCRQTGKKYEFVCYDDYEESESESEDGFNSEIFTIQLSIVFLNSSSPLIENRSFANP